MLANYGVSSNESICDALGRMLREHSQALETASELGEENGRLMEESKLAQQTRDIAQERAGVAIDEARAAQADMRNVRRLLEIVLPLLPEQQQSVGARARALRQAWISPPLLPEQQQSVGAVGTIEQPSVSAQIVGGMGSHASLTETESARSPGRRQHRTLEDIRHAMKDLEVSK